MAEYFITEVHYVEASLLALKKYRRYINLILLLLPPLIYLVFRDFYFSTVLFFGVCYLIVFLFIGLILPFIFRQFYRNTYRRNPIFHRQQEVTISGSEIRLSSENGTSRYLISDLKRIECHKNLILIFPATSYYHMIPTTALSESELELIRRYCTGTIDTHFPHS